MAEKKRRVTLAQDSINGGLNKKNSEKIEKLFSQSESVPAKESSQTKRP